LEDSFRGLLWRTPSEASFGGLLQRPPLEDSFRCLLWRTPSEDSFGGLLQRTPLGDSFRGILWWTPSEDSFEGLLQRTPLEDSFRGLLWRTPFAALERFFSKGHQILSWKGFSLKPKTVEKLLCLKVWYQRNNLSCLNLSSVFFEFFFLSPLYAPGFGA
jgi:hypothetical protein